MAGADKNVCEDRVLVLAGDNLLDFSIKGFIDFYKEKNTTCIMRHYTRQCNQWICICGRYGFGEVLYYCMPKQAHRSIITNHQGRKSYFAHSQIP